MAEVTDTIRVGAAGVEITPPLGVRLAGHGRARLAEEVLDPLWARAMVIEAGGRRAAMVTVDCIGLPAAVTSAIAESVATVPATAVTVCATQTHSAPDTLGWWGPAETVSGLETGWLAQLADGAGAALAQAADSLRPARLTFAQAPSPSRTSVNTREPSLRDDQVVVLRATDAETGQGIATLVNWACRPETLSRHSRAVSSDFVGPLREGLETALGGVGLYANGAMGARVTVAAALDEPSEARRIGQAVADTACSAVLASRAMVDRGTLRTAGLEVRLPCENDRWRAAIQAGLAPWSLSSDGLLTTRLTAFGIGPATFLGLPGRPSPAVGKYLKRAMQRSFRFLFGLANDDLGEILRRADHEDPIYARDVAESLGPDSARRLALAARQLIETVEG